MRRQRPRSRIPTPLASRQTATLALLSASQGTGLNFWNCDCRHFCACENRMGKIRLFTPICQANATLQRFLLPIFDFPRTDRFAADHADINWGSWGVEKDVNRGFGRPNHPKRPPNLISQPKPPRNRHFHHSRKYWCILLEWVLALQEKRSGIGWCGGIGRYFYNWFKISKRHFSESGLEMCDFEYGFSRVIIPIICPIRTTRRQKRPSLKPHNFHERYCHFNWQRVVAIRLLPNRRTPNNLLDHPRKSLDLQKHLLAASILHDRLHSH